MTISFDVETHYHYLSSFEAMTILKEFHSVGVNVNVHARYYNLHRAGRFYSASFENIELVNMLAPHLFKSSTFYEAYEEEFNEAKKELVKRICKGIDDDFTMDDDFYTYAFIHYKSDFSKVTDLYQLKKAAYPLLHRFRHLNKEDSTYLLYTKEPQNLNYAETDDGMSFYFYLNEEKNEFLLAYDMNFCGYRCYNIAALLCELKRICKED